MPEPTTDLPRPGLPEVIEIDPGINRWTFASDEHAVQEDEFNYWLGWFGQDETDEPFEVYGKVWLVRKP